MNKENEKFLALYRAYETLLRQRGTDYRVVEEQEAPQNGPLTAGRMTIMRQMRNYLSHADDPEFVIVSSTCISMLEKMIKEERLKGDLVKNHLITPARGSLKEGMRLSEAIYRLSKLTASGICSMPVYIDNARKELKGVVTLEQMAAALAALKKGGDVALTEKNCGPYSKAYTLVRPDDLVPEGRTHGVYVLCTKDGGPHGRYLGHLDD